MTETKKHDLEENDLNKMVLQSEGWKIEKPLYRNEGLLAIKNNEVVDLNTDSDWWSFIGPIIERDISIFLEASIIVEKLIDDIKINKWHHTRPRIQSVNLLDIIKRLIIKRAYGETVND